MTESTSTVSDIDVTKKVDDKPKYTNIWMLSDSSPTDQDRLYLFLDIFTRFTINITDQLPEKQEKDPHNYSNRKCLFVFTLDQENEDNKKWFRIHWSTIHHWFPVKDSYQARTRERLVTNTLRHLVHWMNTHYQFEQPILYQNKDIPQFNPLTNKKDKNKKHSFIAF